ncbi:hypothetical protein [Candidatus Uabimicrobium amorphum]|uniref:Tetratricopeptide repeat protein n=1 Tax=Uabimicrobium amorphum TaxID=2596890 RepID=A0A5S9ISF9_UABAM|nr:hypothetical protein [Candidatus Uabimicrobium amorphum]BBM86776.1 hypothetical protein UABAM_05164 [Candidatus Uabimicrobium amorphum]
MRKLFLLLCLIFSVCLHTDEIWQQGVQLEKEDKWQEAGDFYFAIAQKNADNKIKLEAFLKARRSYHKANNKIQIAASYFGALALDPQNKAKYWKQIWHIGEELEHKRNWLVAAKYYASFAHHTREAQIKTAFCHKQVGEYVKAADCYREMLKSWSKQEQRRYIRWGEEAAKYYEEGEEWLSRGLVYEILYKNTENSSYLMKAAEAFSRSKDTFNKSSETYKIASQIEKNATKARRLWDKHLYYKLKHADLLYAKEGKDNKISAAQEYIAYADGMAPREYYKASEVYWKVVDLYKALGGTDYYAHVYFRMAKLEELHKNFSQAYNQVYKAIRAEEKTAKDMEKLPSSLGKLQEYFTALLQMSTHSGREQDALRKQQQTIERLRQHYAGQSEALALLDDLYATLQVEK